MKAPRILLVVLAVFFAAPFPLRRHNDPSSFRAGHVAHAAKAPAGAPQAPAPVPDPPGTIDGSKNPELIPDNTAYRLVFLALAEPQDPTPEQKARALGKMTPIGFSSDDAEAFLALLGEFDTTMSSINAQLAQIAARSPILSPGSTDAQTVLDLNNQTAQLFNNTIAALPSKLSAQGVAQLQTYVQQAKRGMKIIPDSSVNMPMN